MIPCFSSYFLNRWLYFPLQDTMPFTALMTIPLLTRMSGSKHTFSNKIISCIDYHKKAFFCPCVQYINLQCNIKNKEIFFWFTLPNQRRWRCSRLLNKKIASGTVMWRQLNIESEGKKVCKHPADGRGFYPACPVPLPCYAYRHRICEILLNTAKKDKKKTKQKIQQQQHKQ